MTSPMISPSDPAHAGQRHYTPGFLKIYDPLVLGLFANLVWRCPTGRLVEHYDRHLRRRHIDVGPGTGYFLERAWVPSGATITLADPNPDVLDYAASRLAHLDVSALEADVCKPLPTGRRFDSAALNYVLHCLPGPMSGKAGAIANVAAVLNPDGLLFGATVLGSPHVHTRLSRAALHANNRRGIFDNLGDTEPGLRSILDESFGTVDVDLVGSVAVFVARHPRETSAAAGS